MAGWKPQPQVDYIVGARGPIQFFALPPPRVLNYTGLDKRQMTGKLMETVRIYRLTGLRPRYRARLRTAQMEAAKVWTLCRDMHLMPAGSAAMAGGEGPRGRHQRPVCPVQPDHPGDLSRLSGQHRGDTRTAKKESEDSLPLQRQTLLSAALARSGSDPGAWTYRVADGTRAILIRLSYRHIGADEGV